MTIYVGFESIYEFLQATDLRAWLYVAGCSVSRPAGSQTHIDHYILLAQPQPNDVLHYLRVHSSTTTHRTSYPDLPDAEQRRLRDVHYSNALGDYLYGQDLLVCHGLVHLPANLQPVDAQAGFLDDYLEAHPEMTRPRTLAPEA